MSRPDPPQSADQLDARGLLCPEPLMLVRNRLRGMPAGAVLHIRATDPSTVRDFTNLCRFLGHELIAQWADDGEFEFWIQRG